MHIFNIVFYIIGAGRFETLALQEGSNDILDYYQMVPIRFKKKDHTHHWGMEAKYEFWTKAFNRNFHAILKPSGNIVITRDTTVSYHLGPKTVHSYVEPGLNQYVEGGLEGDTFSLVQGNLRVEEGWATQFLGVMRTGVDVFVIEPARRLFPYSESSAVVIYRDWDSQPPRCNANATTECGELLLDAQARARAANRARVLPDRRSSVLPTPIHVQTVSDIRGLSCGIEVIYDYLALRHYDGNDNELHSEIMLMFKLVDHMFRLSDINADGMADNIGISIEKFSAYLDAMNGFTPPRPEGMESVRKNEMQMRERESYVFLYDCIKRASNSCLTICVSYRNWGGRFAIATLPSVTNLYNSNEYSGGICASNEYGSSGGGSLLNLNTAIFNLAGPNQTNTTLMQKVHALVHEIGHAFGAKHDPSTPECLPTTLDGHYIMSDYFAGLSKGPNLRRFSPCSLRDIKKILHQKGICLKNQTRAWCGNAIVEPGEECDCGSVEMCERLDPCCLPPGGSQNALGCQLRENAQCSFRPDRPCCSRECRIRQLGSPCYGDEDLPVANRSRMREEEENCIDPRRCDGNSASCPSKTVSKDRSPCGYQSHLTCSRGTCNSNACADNADPQCECEKQAQKCELCCQRRGENCAPASTLYNLPSPVRLGLGEPCNNFRGYCNHEGLCVYKAFGRRAKGWFARNWSYLLNLLMLLILLLLIILLCFCRKKREEDDEKESSDDESP